MNTCSTIHHAFTYNKSTMTLFCQDNEENGDQENEVEDEEDDVGEEEDEEDDGEGEKLATDIQYLYCSKFLTYIHTHIHSLTPTCHNDAGDEDEEEDEAEGGTGKRAAEDDDDEVSGFFVEFFIQPDCPVYI